MSFIKNIPLRPHHGMCLAYFKGEGYSNGFSAHMQECWTFSRRERRYSFMQIQTRSVLPVRIMKKDAVLPFHLQKHMTMQCWICVAWRMDRLWNLMILQILFKRKSWHQERGKKSVGIVSGTPSVKVRRADGRNAKKNRVTE